MNVKCEDKSDGNVSKVFRLELLKRFSFEHVTSELHVRHPGCDIECIGGCVKGGQEGMETDADSQPSTRRRWEILQRGRREECREYSSLGVRTWWVQVEGSPLIGAGNPLTGSISYQKGTTMSFIWKGHGKMGLCGLVSLWYKRKHIWGDLWLGCG